MSLRNGSFVLTALLAVGCSFVIKVDRDQCETALDCLGHGLSTTAICVSNSCVEPPTVDAGEVEAGPVDPKWGCVGKTTVAKIDEKTPIRFRWRFLTALDEQPYAGLHFAACGGLDLTCEAPIANTSGETDEDGVLDVQLYKGFRGYLYLTPTERAPIMPSLFYFKPPEGDVDVGPVETQVHLLTRAQFGVLVASIGVPEQPTDGHIFGLTFDCQYNAGAGVRIKAGTVGSDTRAYYTDDNRVPSLSQQESGTRGEAGYINMPPGSTTLTYSRNGVQIGSTAVAVRAQHITFAPMVP